MDTIQFDKLFEPSNKSVLDFFQISGAGYYIPEYQRGYSWDKDNITQLLTDINEGVSRLADGGDFNQEIHFLGTIITVTDNGIGPKHKDPKGKPTRIDMIIDGQQRVITISIIASILVKELKKYFKQIKSSSPAYSDVKEIVETWNKKLMDIISFDLLRGNPHLKPKIIRGGLDYWTFEDDIELAYQSEFAKYQAQFINAYTGSGTDFPAFEMDGHYKDNAKQIQRWLSNTVAKAHEDNESFPDAQSILNHFSEDLLWDYNRSTLKSIIEKQFTSEKDKESSTLCSLVQTLAACHYLLQRCCFCVIRPANEDWAFDMFQSLNATGTPLTAIETFKPVVLNYMKLNKTEYRGSVTETYFTKVENFLSLPNSAVQKTKRTNEFLVSFFVAYKGEKVPTHFSGERKALVEGYSSLSTAQEKVSFIKKMGDYSDFFDLWLAYDGNKLFKLNESHEELDLASLLLIFLKDSNHRMAITTIGTMYQGVLDNTLNAGQSFIESVKATAAFYFFWRTAYSNNGLDVAYRDFFKECFEQKREITAGEIKRHFAKSLNEKGFNKESWKRSAALSLRYGNSGNDLVKIALLISSTDTIPDSSVKGSVKKGKVGTFDYLKVKNWKADDLKTIEHIAPQTNPGTWDDKLYDPDTMYVNSLGNLTLLPVDINASIGNKSLQEKLLYYKAVAEDDPAVLEKLSSKAKALGFTLSESTINLLKNSKYAHHIHPISTLDYCDTWKADLVKTRTNAMLDIIWDTLTGWLPLEECLDSNDLSIEFA